MSTDRTESRGALIATVLVPNRQTDSRRIPSSNENGEATPSCSVFAEKAHNARYLASVLLEINVLSRKTESRFLASVAITTADFGLLWNFIQRAIKLNRSMVRVTG